MMLLPLAFILCYIPRSLDTLPSHLIFPPSLRHFTSLSQLPYLTKANSAPFLPLTSSLLTYTAASACLEPPIQAASAHTHNVASLISPDTASTPYAYLAERYPTPLPFYSLLQH